MSEWQTIVPAAETGDGWQTIVPAKSAPPPPSASMGIVDPTTGTVSPYPGMTGQDLGQFARGAASGFIGGPGAAEELAVRGLRAVGAAGENEKTIFPTPSEVEKWFGSAPQGEGQQVYRTVGEIVGGLASPVAAIKAANGVTTAIKAAPRTVGELTAAATKDVSKIGKASDVDTLGARIKTDLEKRYDAVTVAREKEMNKLAKRYFAASKAKAADVANDYKSYLDHLATVERDNLSKEESALVADLRQRLGETPSVEKIEKERRYIRDVQSGKVEQFQAIEKGFAADIGNFLEKSLRSHIPESGQFIDAYKELSVPVNEFEKTILGRQATQSASPYLKDVPRYDPAILPDKFFKSKFSINQLRALSGGDQKFVNEAASEYAATKLQNYGPRQAGAAQEWLTANKGWLDEVPEVKAQAERYVRNLTRVRNGMIVAAPVGGYYGLHKLGAWLGW